jgi:Ca-activated chloride channel family protein
MMADNDRTQTMVAPGGEQGAATASAQAEGNATVVVTQQRSAADVGDATVVGMTTRDGTVAVARVAQLDLGQLKPQVEYTLRAHNTFALAGQTVQNYLLADIQGFFGGMLGPGSMTARAPVALALAIDRSGSMEGRPIEAVKTAVGVIVDQLTEADMLSIVTFGEQVDVLMPASRVLNRELIKQHVERIRPKGTTNLYGGIGIAAEQLLAARAPQHLSRTLVLTDGEANEGITDYADFMALARDLRAKGMTVSAIGLGVEYNEELMRGLAKAARGNYYYIDSLDRIPEVFERELKSLFGTVATGVTLKLTLADGVQLTRAYGYEAAQGGRTVSLDLPDIASGASLPVLLQLGVKPHPPARFRAAQSELSFKYFGQGERTVLHADLLLEFTTDKDKIMGGIDAVVEAAMREKDVVANLQRAAAMMKQDVGTATMIIQQAEAQLMAAGNTHDATLVGIALGKLQRGAVDDATKTLSVAEFELER